MSKVKVYASELTVGTVLANGNTVVTVAQWLYDSRTTYTESDGTFHEVWSFQPVALAAETNCLYGGLKPGHSSGFCTAHSCY
jgi:hypothetical protein